MTEEERKLLIETAIAAAALAHLLADGEGLASLNEFRRRLDERFAPLLNSLVAGQRT